MRTFILALVLLYATTGYAQDDYNYEDGLAVKGYDVVGYFTTSSAIKGNEKYAVTHNGGTYLFSSEENMNIFISNPEQYEPAYGGWCAYAYAKDASHTPIDPKTFKIVDNKLYLFYKSFPVNTRTKWNKDEEYLKAWADRFWDNGFTY